MPIQMALSPWQEPQPVIQLTARNTIPEGVTEHQAHELRGANYVELASDEKEGAIAEAHVDSLLGDLELLSQEQLAVLAEDAAE